MFVWAVLGSEDPALAIFKSPAGIAFLGSHWMWWFKMRLFPKCFSFQNVLPHLQKISHGNSRSAAHDHGAPVFFC